jgi:hypothetical protein
MLRPDGTIDKSLGRPEPPQEWGHSETEAGHALTWHHVLPWRLLRDFWNAMVEHQHWNVAEELAWLSAYGTRNEISKHVKSMEKKAFCDRQNENSLAAKLCWRGWNIVEGPSNRADDPGDKYDNFVKVTGLTSWQQERMVHLHQVHQLMSEFSTAYVGNQRVGNDVARELAGFARHHKNSPLITFNEDMWIIVERAGIGKDGRLKSGGPQQPLRQHLWKKAKP